MKVTVCFGALRIVVPCGSGDLLVKDLIHEATRRYKKAAGKDPDSWVAVHHLQTQSGILDPDDCLRDVADDRDQIIASFEDSGPDPGVPQGGGDGASGSSSVGTGSPDIFRDPTNTDAPTNSSRGSNISTPHIEVTSTTSCPITGMAGLQVRRSSDPNLLASLKAEGSNKRWSAAAPHCAGDSPERLPTERGEKGGSYHLAPQWEEDDDTQQHAVVAPAQQPFARSGRLSMQFLGDGTGYRWMEAAEKLQQQQPTQQAAALPQNSFSSKSLPRETGKRKEPLGQAYESIREKDGEMLLIINEYGSPLGLTALPDNEHGGGLVVQHVEPGSRAERGRLRRGDRILEINGIKLIGLTEDKVQDQLRRSLESSELRVRVLRGGDQVGKSRRRDSKVAEMIEAEEKVASAVEAKIATVSPTRKPNTAPVGTSLQVANTRKLGRKIEILLTKGPNGLGFSVTTRDNPAGGHCPIYIKNILPRGAAIEDGRLKPGDRLLEVDGLPMTGKRQTDVVAVLRATQPGATVRLVVSRQQELAELDEREINYNEEKDGEELNSPAKPPPPVLPASLQKSHHHHPQQQQQHKQHQQKSKHNAHMVKKSSSARSLFEQHQQQVQQNLNESQHFIDAGSESAASSDSLQAGIAWRSREVLTLHIPVHDTEKAGLGVSVKGKTTSHNSASSAGGGSMKNDGDLGIFVKSVIHGGAASRDGRLRMNDQLLSVNGVSLLGQNNAEAMETLRRAMVNNPGKHPGMITLSVARKIARSASSGDILEQTNDSSSTSENSGATVIYLSPEKKDGASGGLAVPMGRGISGGINDMNRWSNPVLDRLTGGACSSGSSNQPHRSLREQQPLPAGCGTAGVHALRNESYYMATNDTWSPSLQQPTHYPHPNMVGGGGGATGHINNSVLIEDDPEPMSPTLPHRPADSPMCSQNSTAAANSSNAGSGAPHFDATYSSQLSLETNNSGIEHFSRDALGRRSISEKHHAALDARETGTYQRNKKVREERERERERRIQLTKSAIYGGSVESLAARIANANAQIPGYKHSRAASGIAGGGSGGGGGGIAVEHLQSEALDQVGDLGPSLGLKKSSSLESLQTMVQEIQMSDEPRGGPTALRAPRGRGREDSLRAAVVSDDVNKPRKHWLLEEGTDPEAGFASHRNGPFQSSLNDGKHKSRAKKPSILRGIGHMFRFGKNRKDGVAPADTASQGPSERITNAPNNQIPVAALAAMDRNAKIAPPAYQPPPLPPANHSGVGGGGVNSNGIHHNDIFNHRYQHYANYDELQQQQQQQQMSRRHQHYHSQRSARSQDVNLHHQLNGMRSSSSYYEYETVQHNVSSPTKQPPPQQQQQQHQEQQQQLYRDRDRDLHPHQQQQQPLQRQRNGGNSMKQNGNAAASSPITINGGDRSRDSPQPHWKLATLNGFSPASLSSSARSRGPFVTQVTIRDLSAALAGKQPTYQTVQKQQQQQLAALQQQQQHQQQQQQRQTQYAVVVSSVQPHASKV